MSLAAHLTQTWEESASVLKQMLEGDATALEVEACFMIGFFPATLSIICFFLQELLEGVQKQAVPTGLSQGCFKGWRLLWTQSTLCKIP
jgi:hypothetical protein